MVFFMERARDPRRLRSGGGNPGILGVKVQGRWRVKTFWGFEKDFKASERETKASSRVMDL